jgi:hypothetical protein
VSRLVSNSTQFYNVVRRSSLDDTTGDAPNGASPVVFLAKSRARCAVEGGRSRRGAARPEL